MGDPLRGICVVPQQSPALRRELGALETNGRLAVLEIEFYGVKHSLDAREEAEALLWKDEDVVEPRGHEIELELI